MKLTFEFNAPQSYAFGQKQPEKSIQVRLNPESEEAQFFNSVLKKPQNVIPSSHLGQVQSLAQSFKEFNQNNKIEPNSKKNVQKEGGVNLGKTSKDSSVMENSQASKDTSKQSKILLLASISSEMKSLLVPKPQVEKKEQAQIIKPLSVNQPIEVKRQIPIQTKTSYFASNNPFMASKPSELQFKPPVYSSISIFGNSRVQQTKTTVPSNGINYFIESKKPSEIQSKPSVLPQNSIFRNYRPPDNEMRPPPLQINGQPAVNMFGGSVSFTEEIQRPTETIKKPIPIRHNPFENKSVHQVPNVFQRLAPSNFSSNSNHHLNNQRLNTFHSVGTHKITQDVSRPKSPIPRTFSVSHNQINQHLNKRPEPCLYPIRIQREWEEAHGKKWYQLKSNQIQAANESMKKRLERQNNRNLPSRGNTGVNPLINRNNTASIQQQISRKSKQNPFFNNNHDKDKHFRF